MILHLFNYVIEDPLDNFPFTPLDFLFLSIFVGALIFAAVSDVRRLEIPNWISITLVVSFFLAALVSGLSFTSITIQFGTAFGIFPERSP